MTDGHTNEVQITDTVKLFLKLYGQSSLKERYKRLKKVVETAENKGKPVLI